ncbi:hypothetical protein NPIL_36041 [Nephila pilipes]|uniref:Uncharacterized protein n=1 Tax=Nephila pilipes TaxID=299642 RepID=A0A8X6Q3X7_NEPPI|nr:hypothetical protein NPIL_36041 [Nephila pilipes]
MGEIIYNLRTEVKFDQAERCVDDENCKKKDLFLYFLFDRMEIERFIHEPKYEHCTVESDFFLRYRALCVGARLHNDSPETSIRETVTEVEDGRILRCFMYLRYGAANCNGCECGDVQLHWWIHGHVVRNFSGVSLRLARDSRLFAHLPLPEQKEAQETFNTQKLSHVKKSMY